MTFSRSAFLWPNLKALLGAQLLLPRLVVFGLIAVMVVMRPSLVSAQDETPDDEMFSEENADDVESEQAVDDEPIVGSRLSTSSPGSEDETPAQAIEEGGEGRVYVAESRTDINKELLVEAVRKAESDHGIRLIVAAPADPQPSFSAYARRLQEAADLRAAEQGMISEDEDSYIHAAVVFDLEGRTETFAADEFLESDNQAVTRARQQNSPAETVATYASELSSGGSQTVPFFIIALLAAILLLLYLAYWSSGLERNERKRLRAERMQNGT